MKRVIVRLFSIVAIVLVAGLVPSELRADEKDGVKIYVAESGFEDALLDGSVEAAEGGIEEGGAAAVVPLPLRARAVAVAAS